MKSKINSNPSYIFIGDEAVRTVHCFVCRVTTYKFYKEKSNKYEAQLMRCDRHVFNGLF